MGRRQATKPKAHTTVFLDNSCDPFYSFLDNLGERTLGIAEMYRHFRTLVIAMFAILVPLASTNRLRAQGVRGFGAPQGKLPIRGFGNPKGEEALRVLFPEAAASIVGDDRSLARMQITKTDINGDGMVTEPEWIESEYQPPERFAIYDLNGDGFLTFYEHCIGTARWRRRTERRADEQRLAEQARIRNEVSPPKPSALLPDAPHLDPRVFAREEQVQELAGFVFREYDTNQDRVIERAEFQSQGKPFQNISGADLDRDNEISRDEISRWLSNRLPPLSRLAADLQSRDIDQDDQLTFKEFTEFTEPTSINQRSIDEFALWDRNDDGLITPNEDVPRATTLNTYDNVDPLVIKPSSLVVSDVWVEEDYAIDDLEVSVEIAKENDNYTQLILLSPQGKRVTLYAGDGWQPWRGALILKGITFRDSAPLIENTLNRPPYRRELRPPATNESAGLSSLRGDSARGKWRLIVRNQNDRAGLLARWSLAIRGKRANPGMRVSG